MESTETMQYLIFAFVVVQFLLAQGNAYVHPSITLPFCIGVSKYTTFYSLRIAFYLQSKR